MQYWGNVNDCTVTYNDAIMRRDGTGRGRRRLHGDVCRKKNRVTANGGGVVKSMAGTLYCYYYMYTETDAPRLSCANKLNAYVDNR